MGAAICYGLRQRGRGVKKLKKSRDVIYERFLSDVTILGIGVGDIFVATRTMKKARDIVEYLDSHFGMTS